MKQLNLAFEDREFERLKSKKEKGENWQEYLLRLVSGSNEEMP